MADMEVGGVKFSGFGKIGIAVTALSTRWLCICGV